MLRQLISRKVMIMVSIPLMLGAAALVGLSSGNTPEPEKTYPVTVELEGVCKPKDGTLLTVEKEGKDSYQLYGLNSYSFVISKTSGGTCKVLNPTGAEARFVYLVPESVVSPLSNAWWSYRIHEAGGKASLEKELATTRIGVGLNAVNYYSEDLASWQALGIKYPEYFRPVDSFKSEAENEAYYGKIFTDEWYQKNQPEGGEE